jgi:hypothetical protein
MMRGLALSGSEYPFASADSVNIGRNHNRVPSRGGYAKDVNRMADDIDGRQCAPRWVVKEKQSALAF